MKNEKFSFKKISAFGVGTLLLIFCLQLTGCAKSPLEKLQSDIQYPDLNNAFWAKEHDAKTPLWNDGLAYCKSRKEKVNCGALMTVYMISNGSTDVPKYGSSGNSLHMPNFG